MVVIQEASGAFDALYVSSDWRQRSSVAQHVKHCVCVTHGRDRDTVRREKVKTQRTTPGEQPVTGSVRRSRPPGGRSSWPEEGRWRRDAEDDGVEAEEEEEMSTRLCRAGGGGGGGWDGGRLLKGSSSATTRQPTVNGLHLSSTLLALSQ